MKRHKTNRLERKLTYRMVQVQILALMLFFGACVFPLVVYPIFKELGDAKTLDTTITEQFAQSLRSADGHTIMVAPNARLQQLIAEFPDIWFHASTKSGASIVMGAVPLIYREVAEKSWGFESFDVRTLNSGKGGMGLRTQESPIGTVRVMTGNGPVVSAANIIGWLLGALGGGIAVTVAIVSAVVIPVVVRREMRGLKAAAAQARLIHSHARGARLSLDDVPDEVAPLVLSVNDALSRLDQSYVARERFLADSAHELRTPIAIMQTRIEAEDSFPAQTKLLVDVARLSILADQLLDLQRMDLTGTNFGAVDLNEVASEVVGDLAPLASAAGYELSLIAAADRVIVDGDIGSLVRAVTNIVQNAIAYGGQHGEILVQVDRNGSIAISDKGPGIPAHERDRVLEPFYRITHTTRGTGLGLNLVDMIIRRHQGHLSLGDSASGGAMFVISLPLGSTSAKNQSRL